MFKALPKEVSQFQALARPFLPIQRLLSKVEQHFHGPSLYLQIRVSGKGPSVTALRGKPLLFRKPPRAKIVKENVKMSGKGPSTY